LHRRFCPIRCAACGSGSVAARGRSDRKASRHPIVRALSVQRPSFIAAQRANADRPEARVTLGSFLAGADGRSKPRIEYKAAQQLSPPIPGRVDQSG